jgi:hypothetical protein
MKALWFNVAALVVFFGLVLNGAPVLPVLAGVLGAAGLNFWRQRHAG